MKKLLSLIIAIAMILSLSVVFAVSASAQTEPWDGVAYDIEFAGAGTEEDPYLISTPEELQGLLYRVNYLETTYDGMYLKLTDDINMGGHPFEAIGTNTSFQGNFDGNGKTVFNFTVEGKYGGLFGVVKNNGSVKNVKVDYATIATDTMRVGGLVAYPQETATIENCVVGENVTVTNTTSVSSVIIGGIAGQANGVTIKNCISYAKIVVLESNGNDFIGGVVGAPGKNAVVENVISYSDITVEVQEKTSTNPSYCGGIVGAAGGGKLDCVITNAINYGSVKALVTDGYAGGVCGVANSGVTSADICGTFKNIYNASADVQGTAGTGMFAGNFGKPVAFVEGSTIKLMQTDTMNAFAGVNPDGLETPTALQYTVASSSVDFEVDQDLQAIIAAIDAALPDFAEVTDVDYVAPESSEIPEDTGDEPVDTPADTGDEPVDTPADTNEDPVDKTEPEATNPVTPETDPETEKPAEGGCGSVVAGGLAILAVVTLAGVALKKRD